MLLIMIFILIICIFIIYLTNLFTVEPYNARISGITEHDCGKACTDGYGCVGYGYDRGTAKCYISKYPIIGQPTTDSLYADQYTSYQERCNKIDPIRPHLDPKWSITDYKKNRNTIYSCDRSEEGNWHIYRIVNGQKTPITPEEIINMPYEKYELTDITWPKVKIDKTLLDFTGDQIEVDRNYLLFKTDDREYLGQYLFPYKCVDNIPEKECLNNCAKYKECKGTEWNPSYIKDGKRVHNVCCPKKEISQVITRRDEFKNGRFYIKTIPHELNKDEVYISFVPTRNIV